MHTPSKIAFFLCLIICSSHTLNAAEQTPSSRQKRQRDDLVASECTPAQHQSTPAPTVEPTPGQVVSNRQAELLTKEKFIAVLGKDVINSWGIDWNVFTNTKLEFDAPQKSRTISVIHNKMTSLLKNRFDEEFMTLYGSVAGIRGQREAVHADRLDMIAIKYFTELYPEAKTIESLDKQGGVQLGERIQLIFSDETTLLYHVKTHSEGRLSEKSTAPKLVNPQELLAYKILELLGFGCEVHFFEKNPQDVYIATLDANFISKDKKGNFNVFQKAAGRLNDTGNVSLGSRINEDEDYGQRIWGELYSLRRQISETAEVEVWRTLEKRLQSDEIAQNFIHQQSTLDIITRIMRLSDLLNNPENFGFVSSAYALPQLKVIDFRVIEDPTRLKMTDDQFGGYLVGNGVYNYASSHNTMCYVLRNRPLEARVAHALQIMNTNLLELVDVINRAHEFVSTYLKKEVFYTNKEKLEADLISYTSILRQNTDFFKAKLEDWSPEKDKAREEARQQVLNRAKKNENEQTSTTKN